MRTGVRETLGIGGWMGLPRLAMTRSMLAGACAAFCCLLLARVGPAHAQGRAPDRAVSAPLQYETEDVWADVHRWTGSDETRPRAQRPAARPQQAPRSVGPARPANGTGTVTTNGRTRTNIRVAPDLSAPVVRTMQPSTTLTVFGDAPGGWFNVGESEPFGWVHESALQR